MSTKFRNWRIAQYSSNWNTGLYVKVRQNLINYLSQWFAWETSSLFGKTEQVGLISPKLANRKKFYVTAYVPKILLILLRDALCEEASIVSIYYILTGESINVTVRQYL